MQILTITSKASFNDITTSIIKSKGNEDDIMADNGWNKIHDNITI